MANDRSSPWASSRLPHCECARLSHIALANFGTTESAGAIAQKIYFLQEPL